MTLIWEYDGDDGCGRGWDMVCRATQMPKSPMPALGASFAREDAPVSLMGFGTSKVLPEPPNDVQLDVIKKVEPFSGTKNDVYKHFIMEVDSFGPLKAAFPPASQYSHFGTGAPLLVTQSLLLNHHEGPVWQSTGPSLTHV
ncbi:Serine/threonine-protein kinase H1 [Fukomys damarensis]|uniref:Serine/threonine-protein kinase H1 n=1 Tax=Fukomys damarensis TaxID=885580 RepID=A0A091CQ30_FUKDA|nr:Serine/threonine-protein kinase H1 [Fukomys damarensis]